MSPRPHHPSSQPPEPPKPLTSQGVDPDTIGRPPVISLRNIKKVFGTQTVLESINLDIYPGETMVIMGGSGSGKSTLLRVIIGSIEPNDGQVWMFNQNLCELDDNRLNAVRKKFGILFQSGALFNSMTIGENVALPIAEHTDLEPNIIAIQVKIKLEQVGLREHADKFPGQISGGMKKRAGLARALALDPQVLFYDEPSAGLDPVTSAEIDQLMLNLTKKLGVASVVVTHEMDSAFTIADRMAMLDKGRMIKVATRQEYEQLRDTPADRLSDLSHTDRLIRQFLRGDAEGPLTERKASTNYADDLLGHDIAPPREAIPSVVPTRSGTMGPKILAPEGP
ncbi:MAG: ABC transporter ATP-binding protein [Phycisphaerales bacterium]